MMRNILVGIRLSQQSPVVFQYALNLAQQFGASLTLTYILQERIEDLARPRADRAAALEKFRAEQEQKLQVFIETQYSKKAHRVPIKLIVKYDYTYDALGYIAEKEAIDLIVLGKLGGNNAEAASRLAQYAPCPILTVPMDVKYKPLHRIVYASNMMLEDCGAILKLKYWLDIFHAELICLHVCSTAAEKQKAAYRLEILEQLFPQENISFRSIVADIEKGIGRYAQLTQSDLIATMQRERKKLWGGFFKTGISKAMKGELEVPMLVF